MLSHARRAAAATAISIAVAALTAPAAFAGQTTHYYGPYSTQEACEDDRPYFTWPGDYTFPCRYYATAPYPHSGPGSGWYFKHVTTWDG